MMIQQCITYPSAAAESIACIRNVVPKDTAITIIAPAYRRYWKSTGRASQRGLEINIATVLASLPSSYVDNPMGLSPLAVAC
jgi:hypothetical protein